MAVGIGLVFGVLRLVNFAYGQLIMAGAFALAFGDQWGLPNWLSILFCFGVVLALSVAHGPSRLPAAADALAGGDAGRDLRGRVHPPERRALAFGSFGKTAGSLAVLQAPWTSTASSSARSRSSRS